MPNIYLRLKNKFEIACLSYDAIGTETITPQVETAALKRNEARDAIRQHEATAHPAVSRDTRLMVLSLTDIAKHSTNCDAIIAVRIQAAARTRRIFQKQAEPEVLATDGALLGSQEKLEPQPHFADLNACSATRCFTSTA